MKLPVRWMFACSLFAACTAAWGAEFSCGGKLVELGDTKGEVFLKCGEPSWREQWGEEIIEDFASPPELRTTRTNELWVYNLGPRQFMRFLHFSNNRLADVDVGEYGYREDTGAPVVCNPGELRTGMIKPEVLSACGGPDFADSHQERRVIELSGGIKRAIVVRIDEWLYNLGPTRFVRILTFENGELVRIERGDRGTVK